MAERSAPAIERALASVAADVDVPAAPALAVSVVSRLLVDRAAETRPVLPRRALWSPRTRLIAATVAVVALLAIAAGARYAIGVAEIRIEPERAPSGPPITPASLGEPTPLAELEDAVGFAIHVPARRPPDAAWASTAGGGTAILAWRADARWPRLHGTPWGLLLVEVADGDDEILVKRVSAFDDTDEIVLDGGRAFWIHAPHELLVVTDHGDERFLIEGNVLIWERGDVTYRLETSLPLAEALAVAGRLLPFEGGNPLPAAGV
ncbi:MAG TPA: hypothetical protein VEC09_09675 [Actinomycetota bacterium]|nr:hypothetical protein [Actinomycetota bacterium]